MHVDTWKVPSSPPTNRNVSTNVCFMLWSFVLCSNSEQEYEGYMKVNYCAKIGILKLVRFILGKFRQFLWWSSPGSCPGDAIWRALATMSWSLPFVLRPPWGCARGKGRPGRRRELHNVSSKGAGEMRQPGRTLVYRNHFTPRIILFWYCMWDLFLQPS